MISIIRNINLKNEVLAGITVALALVPEVIAFAFEIVDSIAFHQKVIAFAL